MTVEFREEFVEGGGSKVQVVTGGSGEPLLVLHGAEGTLGWMRLLTALAERFTVYLPSHPGYYQSERPAWLESIADMARFYLWFMDTLGLEGVRAVGHSLGGWLAADSHLLPPRLQQAAAGRCGGAETGTRRGGGCLHDHARGAARAGLL